MSASSINLNLLRLNKASPFAVGFLDGVVGNDPISLKGTIASRIGSSTAVRSNGEVGPALAITAVGTSAFSFAGRLSAGVTRVTLLSWYRLVVAPSANSRLAGNFTSAQFGYGIIPSTTNFRAATASLGANNIITGPAVTTRPVVDVLTYDGTTLSYYQNGVAAGSSAGAMTTPTGSFRLGDDNGGGGNACISEFYVHMLYNYAMPAPMALALSRNPLLPFIH